MHMCGTRSLDYERKVAKRMARFEAKLGDRTDGAPFLSSFDTSDTTTVLSIASIHLLAIFKIVFSSASCRFREVEGRGGVSFVSMNSKVSPGREK